MKFFLSYSHSQHTKQKNDFNYSEFYIQGITTDWANYYSEGLWEVQLRLLTPTPNSHCSTNQYKQKTVFCFSFFRRLVFMAKCQTLFSSGRSKDSKDCFILPQDKGKFFKRIIPKYWGWLQSRRLMFHSSALCLLSCKTLNPIPVEWNMLLCSERAFWKLRCFNHCPFSSLLYR